ncbi:uncharacterized protein LOC124494446 [Dermatophagoides farinae]
MFSCHVLVIMFGLFIVYVRYKMPLSEKGEILIREVFTIYYNKGNIDSNGRGHLKDCDPVTLKRLKQIVQIGEFLMRFGPILYGIVATSYLLVLTYLESIQPPSNVAVIIFDYMIVVIGTITGRSIVSAAICIIFSYLTELIFFQYQFSYWNHVLNRINKHKDHMPPRWCRLLLHSFLQHHDFMIKWLFAVNNQINFIYCYVFVFLFPIHVIMSDLMVFHSNEFAFPNLLLIIIYVSNLTIWPSIIVAWLPIQLHRNIIQINQTLYTLLAIDERQKFRLMTFRCYLKLQTYTQRLTSKTIQIGINIGPFCVTHYLALKFVLSYISYFMFIHQLFQKS